MKLTDLFDGKYIQSHPEEIQKFLSVIPKDKLEDYSIFYANTFMYIEEDNFFYVIENLRNLLNNIFEDIGDENEFIKIFNSYTKDEIETLYYTNTFDLAEILSKKITQEDIENYTNLFDDDTMPLLNNETIDEIVSIISEEFPVAINNLGCQNEYLLVTLKFIKYNGQVYQLAYEMFVDLEKQIPYLFTVSLIPIVNGKGYANIDQISEAYENNEVKVYNLSKNDVKIIQQKIQQNDVVVSTINEMCGGDDFDVKDDEQLSYRDWVDSLEYNDSRYIYAIDDFEVYQITEMFAMSGYNFDDLIDATFTKIDDEEEEITTYLVVLDNDEKAEEVESILNELNLNFYYG